MKSPVFALCAAIALTGAAHAHHSGSMFDRAKAVTLEGTIKEYQFQNPHVWIEVMVPGADGKPVQWSIEAETRATMTRLGLGATAIKPGDKVVVKAHPLRDGRSGGSFINITLPDGTVIDSR